MVGGNQLLARNFLKSSALFADVFFHLVENS